MTMEGTVGEPSLEASGTRPGILYGAPKTDSCYRVLFVCCDSSAHSIIAESILKRLGASSSAPSAPEFIPPAT
jgi:hypothetical protein